MVCADAPAGVRFDSDVMSGFEVVICGGGAGVEGLLRLRRLAGSVVKLTLLCSEACLAYRPLAVREPFGPQARSNARRPRPQLVPGASDHSRARRQRRARGVARADRPDTGPVSRQPPVGRSQRSIDRDGRQVESAGREKSRRSRCWALHRRLDRARQLDDRFLVAAGGDPRIASATNRNLATPRCLQPASKQRLGGATSAGFPCRPERSRDAASGSGVGRVEAAAGANGDRVCPYHARCS